MVPVRNQGRANRAGGSIGSVPRCSTAANAAQAAADTQQPPSTTGEAQPSRPAATSAAVSVPRAATASTWPPRSTARGRGLVAGANRGAASSAPMAIGRFRKNTPRQLHTLTSTPPTMGPLAAPIPAMAPHSPSALDRARGSGYATWSSNNDDGTSTAAPAPWTARAATSTPSDGARPQAADAAPKPTSPAVNTRRPPSRSASAPPVSSRAAKARV